MLFVILWETDPKLVPGRLRFFSPPEGIKVVSEYVTPGGLFIEIIEADSADPVFRYVNKGIDTCRKLEVYPILTIKEWVKNFRPDVSR